MNTNPTTEVLDRVALLDRLGGDLELLHEIALLFAEDCPKLMADIRSAVSSGDARGLERAAHTLKGSVSNFGAEAARAAAFRLELMGRTGDLTPAAAALNNLDSEIERFSQALRVLANELDR